MPNLKKPEAIVFDWDGTLVDTLPGLRLAHNHARTSLGFPEWTEEQFHSNLKHSARELYPRIYGDRSDEAMEILYKYVDEHHIKHLNILPEAGTLLKFLHDAKIPIGIVSNKNQKYLVREVEHTGWAPYFYCIFGAGAAARDKPAADPILLALERAANAPLHPGNVWFIGDTVTDLLAAREAGCPAVFMTHGHDKSALIQEFSPFLVADSCSKLLENIKSTISATK